MSANNRDEVIKLAKVDTNKASKAADEIEDAWYKTQALAWVAWFADDKVFETIINHAIETSFTNEDPYKIVGSSAWPLRALAERGHIKTVQRILPKVLEIANTIGNPVSRADALFLVWQAVFPLGKRVHLIVLENLLGSCGVMDSWKRPLTIRDVVAIIAKEDYGMAEKIVNEMAEGRVKRQVSKLLTGGEFLEPRSFFWK